MAGTILKTTDVAPAVSPYYDRNLLENARPLLVHEEGLQVRELPQKNSKTIKFRRPNTLAVKKVPIQEGVTPPSSTFSYAEVTAIVKMYGDNIIHSQEVDLYNQDSVIMDMTTEQGYQAGETIDELRRDVLVAGTSVLYANGSSRSAVNTVVAQGDIETVVRAFRNNNVGTVMRKLVASKGISTEPISPAYRAIIHPDLVPTFEGMSAWIPIRKYFDRGPIWNGEIGSVKEVRVCVSSKAKVWEGGGAISGTNVKETSSNADVYAILIHGRNAAGAVPLSGKSLENIVKAVGSAGSADPHNQRGSVAWNVYTTTVILNDNFIYRIECAAKDSLTV